MTGIVALLFVWAVSALTLTVAWSAICSARCNMRQHSGDRELVVASIILIALMLVLGFATAVGVTAVTYVYFTIGLTP